MKSFRRVATLFVGFVSTVTGQTLLVSSPGSGFTTSYTAPYNLGYQFTVGAAPLSVSALGFYDIGTPGFSDSHQVGLWTTSGTLLASVTIPSGTSTLTNGFAFQSLGTPVTLSAGTDYVLSAFWSTNSDQVYANFVTGASPAFSNATLVGSRNTIAGTSSTFEFPSHSGGADGFSWIGANMAFSAVPEPSTCALVLGIACVLAAAARRKCFNR